ncbi:MAG TPA: M23 family metallopeptidase [Candidatus Limnocylindrales bacterium]|nr:M23 family metallopeptidase [Candidatus Limnocylindrales bacterium]
MGNRIRVIFWTVFIAAGSAAVGWSYYARWSAEKQFSAEALLARAEARRIQEQVVLFTEKSVPPRIPFYAVLLGMGIDSQLAARAVAAAQPVFDLRHLRAGNRLEVGRSVLGEFRAVRYRIDTDRVLWIAPQGDDFHSEIQTIPSETGTTGVSGEIHGSLFEGIVDAGEKPELAMRLAEIFGYDLDFYTDPRPGDTFRVVVEKKKLADGSTAAYGRILAAEYNNQGRAYRAVLFHDPSGHPAYYTPEGKSMKKAFLHSPLKFAAPISSHYSTHRFHPILKEYRPHLGIDYAAPTGTPVQTIGDGRVIFAGAKRGAGNMIEVQHTNGYTTYYMHLSRILVRGGQRVEQGQRIGLVGMTGLATGPHLDFRIERRGQFLNFERLPLPPSDPVTKREWAEFSAARDHALDLMPLPYSQRATVASNAAPATAPAPQAPSPAGNH